MKNQIRKILKEKETIEKKKIQTTKGNKKKEKRNQKIMDLISLQKKEKKEKMQILI